MRKGKREEKDKKAYKDKTRETRERRQLLHYLRKMLIDSKT